MDDIVWAITDTGGIINAFFAIDTELLTNNKKIPAKLIYSSRIPYSERSVKYLTKDYGQMYKVVYEKDGQAVRLFNEQNIQKVARGMGFEDSSGLFGNISLVQKKDVVQLMSSVPFLERFSSLTAESISNQVADHYGVDKNCLRLTGGAQLNGESIEKQHDLDIVVPVDSEAHATTIWRRIRDKKTGHLIENGFKSPMRWIEQRGSMICPFFVYSQNMDIPIKDIVILGAISATLEVMDSSFSIFNMPILITKGIADFVVFRSRVSRSCISEETLLVVNANLVEVTSGSWRGRRGVLILNPFEEIENLSVVMEKWRA